MKRGLKLVINSLLIAAIGVFVIDYFSHLFFSSPMETPSYFLIKFVFYFVFSLIFLYWLSLRKREFVKVLVGGIIVTSIFGLYYNVFPEIFNYYPLGIALRGLSFLGMGRFVTGLAFGTVHTIAFLGGYYISKKILGAFK